MVLEPGSKAERILQRLADFPSLPNVVNRLIRLAESTSSTRDFADLIATDQGLAAKVLRLVNSAFYSLRAPISSIRQASSLLGVRTLKSLALSVSVFGSFRRRHPGFEPVHFWRHALVVALVNRNLIERRKLDIADEAYIAGLLHDLGIGLFVQRHSDEFAELSRSGTEGSAEMLSREEKAFGASHAELAFHVAEQWHLPAIVSLGLRHHHTDPAELPADLEPQARQLIETLQSADGFARRNGYSFSDFDRLEPEPASGSAVRTPDGSTPLPRNKLEAAVSGVEAIFAPPGGSDEPAGARRGASP